MIKLSEKQKQIVEFEEGALLVKAGPGSGKTRVLIERIKRILKRKKRIKILALTFSNMAAEEMKSRIEEDAEISDLIDNVTIGTIHAFCLDLVQNKGYMIGLSDSLVLFESLDDRKKAVDLVNRELSELMEHPITDTQLSFSLDFPLHPRLIQVVKSELESRGFVNVYVNASLKDKSGKDCTVVYFDFEGIENEAQNRFCK